ncbi:MAG: sigma-54-dependent Fis family transcriptional regulator [Vicinamibacteria bacterium]|nr:sigma-54-dependent Fis family transcriptional regulator [Vicinamibacteria bacterium]
MAADSTATRTPAASEVLQKARILLADDQPDVLQALRLLLKAEGCEIDTATSPAGVLAAVEARDFDVALVDLNYARDTTSGLEGLSLLSRLQALDTPMPVVVMTAWGTVDLAVEAMRRGARDFIQKPWDNERVLAVVRTQVELARALRRSQRLEAENRVLRDQGTSRPTLVAESAAMRPVLDLIARVGPSDANVLLTGENGTGKGTVAQSLHAVSGRVGRALVTVNAGGLSEGLFESELFGHVKGAFTDAKSDRVGRFELAEGGTLFLDEIANTSMNLQAKLLRVLETGEFERVGSSRTRRANVRIISATNADLNAEVAAGRFRQDLLFRLNTIEIPMPPLRARREDIPLLARHFLAQHAQRYRKRLNGFDAAAMQLLLDHAWPGNVRELDHAVERAVLMAQGDQVQGRDLGLRATRDATARIEDMSLEEVEGFLIKKALARYDGNVSQAAKALGLSRSALYRRLQRFGL